MPSVPYELLNILMVYPFPFKVSTPCGAWPYPGRAAAPGAFDTAGVHAVDDMYTWQDSDLDW